MSELQILETILNGPVFASSVDNLDFYNTDDNYNVVIYDHYTGDWTVNLHGAVSVKAPTLELAINMAHREWEEYCKP